MFVLLLTLLGVLSARQNAIAAKIGELNNFFIELYIIILNTLSDI